MVESLSPRQPPTTAPFLDLALQGERHSRNNQWQQAIGCFEQALDRGTGDLPSLLAVYSQLGGALFHQGNYTGALKYHRYECALARQLGDLSGEALASGNLGHVLKAMRHYDLGFLSFNRQLIKARQLEDQAMQIRALYHMGTLLQLTARASSDVDDQDIDGNGCLTAATSSDSSGLQRRAVNYFTQCLALLRESVEPGSGDRSSCEGVILGSLGNSYYLLGDFKQAINCYSERLELAKEFGHLRAQRRMFSNIGNAYMFLADFDNALTNYHQALSLARLLASHSEQAQACFSLGTLHTLLRQPVDALAFLFEHLAITTCLDDLVGQLRAYWSLANLCVELDRPLLAKRCAAKCRELADKLLLLHQESANNSCLDQLLEQLKSSDLLVVGDLATNGYHSDADTQDMSGGDDPKESLEADLRLAVDELTGTRQRSDAQQEADQTTISAGSVVPPQFDPLNQPVVRSFTSAPPQHQSQPPPTATQATVTSSHLTVDDLDYADDYEEEEGRHLMSQPPPQPPVYHLHRYLNDDHDLERTADPDNTTGGDPESRFFNFLLRMQSRRMDEQRCVIPSTRRETTTAGGESSNAQSDSNLRSATSVPVNLDQSASGGIDDAFFDLIEGVQGDRMNDQRANMPVIAGGGGTASVSHGVTAQRSASSWFPGYVATTSTASSSSARSTTTSSSMMSRLLHSSSVNRSGVNRPEDTGYQPSNCQQQAAAVTRRGQSTVSADADEDFLDLLYRFQMTGRINDQRSSLPDPLLQHHRRPSAGDAIISEQSALDSTQQRRSTVAAASSNTSSTAGSTNPGEDFFELIQRVQSSRLDEQRCNPPPSSSMSNSTNLRRARFDDDNNQRLL